MCCITTEDLRQRDHIELTALPDRLLVTPFLSTSWSLLHSPSHTPALSSSPSDFSQCLTLCFPYLAAASCQSQSVPLLFMLQDKAFPGSEPAEPGRLLEKETCPHCHTAPLHLFVVLCHIRPLVCSLLWMAPVPFQSSVYLSLSVCMTRSQSKAIAEGGEWR